MTAGKIVEGHQPPPEIEPFASGRLIIHFQRIINAKKLMKLMSTNISLYCLYIYVHFHRFSVSGREGSAVAPNGKVF